MITIILAFSLLGILLNTSNVVPWFRIFEKFHFQSFHMYGIIGSAVVGGLLCIR